MMNINKIVGEQIRAHRKEQGLSGSELGEKLKLSQQQVSRYERGECNIPLDMLFTISLVLEVPFVKLFGDLNNSRDYMF
ncbi:helix-turn-helix domain-containing protein [Morganella morganii]|uniref:helix-turn-helix domain-containing protein n=1 Tax=Morganella morganii TaxID=582 RepID=UPI003BA21994